MNTPIAKILNTTFNLNEDEERFVQKFDNPLTPDQEYQSSIILTNLYTAKIHQQASQQSAEFARINELAAQEASRTSKTITTLTWVLMGAAVVQAAAAVISVIK